MSREILRPRDWWYLLSLLFDLRYQASKRNSIFLSHKSERIALTAPKRIQENLTAAVERRILNWICARLPLVVDARPADGAGLFRARC